MSDGMDSAKVETDERPEVGTTGEGAAGTGAGAGEDAPAGGQAHAGVPADVPGEEPHGDDFETVTVPKAEYDELNDRHLRLVAEFANFRRRAESEALGTWARAQADLVEGFLDVLDDLTRVAALDPADEAVTVQSIVEGIDLVEQKFNKALTDAGAEVIAPGEGDAFDPEYMEAMMRVPADDDGMDDAVAQLFQKGYRMGQTLVRAARVSVYKAD